MPLDFQRLKIVWNRTDSDLKDEFSRYTLPPGDFPSVTKIIDGDNDFLWVHVSKIKDEVNRLAGLAAEGGETDAWVDIDGKWEQVKLPASVLLNDGDHISKAGLRYMKAAADRGTGVHFLFEAWGQGIRPDPDEAKELSEWAVVENNLKCSPEELCSYYLPAIKWLDKYDPVFEMQELVVCDPLRGYAGRTDIRRMLIGDTAYIADIKSHDNLKRGWLMQLAAYRAAPYGYMKDKENIKCLEIDQAWRHMPGCIVMVCPERCGHRVIEPEELDFYLQGFYSRLDVYSKITAGPMPRSQATWTK